MTAVTEKAEPDFLARGGRMGAVMRSMDWAATPFGPVESWPQSLRSAVSICLNSAFPIAIYWGPELNLLYNDLWSPILGNKHPWALTHPGHEVWPEIWDSIGPLFERVMGTGEGVWLQDGLLLMNRHGYTEECYFNYTFSPIVGGRGGVDGIFNVAVETTFRVISERRSRVLRRLAERVAEAKTAEQACARATEVCGAAAEDVSFCLLYLLEGHGRRARLEGAVGLEPGSPGSPPVIDDIAAASPWPIAAAVEGRRSQVVEDLDTRLGGTPPGGVWPDPARQAIVVPIADPYSRLASGVLIAGLSPRRALDEEYRNFFQLAASHLAAAVGNARAYEAERRRAEALAEIDRAKTTFFSNVSHEFRTPLTLMLGPIEESLAQAQDLAERERLELVQRNALRLQKLVNTLLDFARIEAGRVEAVYEPTDLAALTRDLASVFRSAVERAGLRLIVDCPPLKEPVYVDRDMWEKIVLNLVSNAFKFTLSGEIEVALKDAGDAVELRVRDTGSGIPEEQLGRIFERFHRVEGARGRTHEGTGIGLALVCELAKLHGGSVRVASALGRGSTFTVTVPKGKEHLPEQKVGAEYRPAATALHARHYTHEAYHWISEAVAAGMRVAGAGMPAPAVEQRPAIGKAGGARILVVEDNADMRDYIVRLLADRYEVEAVADGTAALAAVRRAPPDLVLTDVMMPHGSGFRLLQDLRADERTRTLPVVLLSARAGEEAAVEGLEAGAHDYLIKPFAARELLARVNAHIQLKRLREQAEAALRDSEERYRTLTELSPDAILVYQDERLVYVNPAAVRLLAAADRDELLHRQPMDIVPAESRALVQERIARVLQQQTVSPLVEQRWLRSDGSPVEVEVTAGRIMWNNRPAVQVLARDIAERKRAEAALRESEERFRSLADNIAQLAWMGDGDGSVFWYSRRWFEYTGTTMDELEGTGWHKVLHPDHAQRVLEKFNRCIASGEYWEDTFPLRGRNGEYRWFLARAVPIGDEHGRVARWLGTNTDITEQRQAEEAVRRLAHHDPLTGLPNRRHFRDIFAAEAAQASRSGGRLAILYVDLDRFKEVNDALGHRAGDMLLKEVAHRLGTVVRKSDIVARVGGDEFNVLLPAIDRGDRVAEVARAIVKGVQQPFRLKGQEVHISASVGISIYPDDGHDLETLLRYADMAMYRAKESGRNNYRFFDTAMNIRSLERLKTVNRLRRAVDRGELAMYYQPVMDLAERRVQCAEALIRWNHPERGLLTPDQFIPLAEETGLIAMIDDWALQTICLQIQDWRAKGRAPLCFTVNLSARQMHNPDLVQRVADLLQETHIPPNCLDIEITEGTAMADVEQTAARLRDLAELGVRISIDDFGTGYSSLSYLKRLPIQRLKIDQSFIRDIAENPDDRAIISAVTAMAHTLQMRVVAEGVENQAQLAFLEQQRCDEAQGYLFSRPLPQEAFEAFVR